MDLEEEKIYTNLISKKDFQLGFCDSSFVITPYRIFDIDLPFLNKNEYGYSFNDGIHDLKIERIIISHYSKFTYFFAYIGNITFTIHPDEIKSDDCYFCFVDLFGRREDISSLTNFRLVSKNAMDLRQLNISVKDIDFGSKTKGVRI